MFSSRMEGLLSALLFLNLALDSSQQEQTELKLTSASPERGSPSAVKLNCTPPGKNTNHGVFWVRQPITKEPPQFTLLYPLWKEKGKEVDAKKFIPNISTGSFELEIKDFSEQDQGTYHCLIKISSILHFSTGVHLEYLTVTAPAPTTTSTTRRHSENCSCQTYPHEEKPEMGSALDLSCSLYILVPLAAVGGLLLIAFLVTFTQLCKFYMRRKRCKHHLKKGPINGNNGNPIVPNRFK